MIVCLHSSTFPQYLTTPLGGSTALERVVHYVRSLPDVTRVVVTAVDAPGGLPESWEIRTKERWSLSQLVGTLSELTDGPDVTLLFGFLDEPFLHAGLTRSLMERHDRYRAEFTFADGYPPGLAPQLVRGRAMTRLVELSAGDAQRPTREGLFPVVQKDINGLDVETELGEVDQRLLRLELNVSSRANLEFCDYLARRMGPGDLPPVGEMQALIERSRTEQRTLPRYVAVQLLDQEAQRVSYAPHAFVRQDALAPGRVMEPDRFASIVSELDALCPEAVVAVSLWGEAALHPGIMECVRAVLDSRALSLYLETSGVGWRPEDRRRLFGVDDERFALIVALDTNDAGVYRELRGDGFEEARRFAFEAIDALPRCAWVQATRLDASEPTLERFHQEWKKRTDHVIVQKYDHYCARLPARKIGDLSPLKRFPCWHLQRGLSILVDGAVPLCREDLDVGSSFGSVFDDGLQAVWARGAARYAEQVAGQYNGICADCDEYYIFNA